MWDFISTLPLPIFFTIIVLLLITFLIVALRGHFKAKIGDKEIELGEDQKDNKDTPQSDQSPKIKRSCGDCVLIMMGEREKYELKMRKEFDRILKTQMTFAEQKLIELQTLLINSFSDAIFLSKRGTITNTSDDENVQIKLFYGLLRDALLIIKDEIRRSFKDNGFFELDATDFKEYTTERTKVLITLVTQHFRNLYPDRSVIISKQELFKILENKTSGIEDMIFQMYNHARDAKLEADARTKTIKGEFSAWIDSFIK